MATSVMNLQTDSENIGAALGRVVSGCSILTASWKGRTTGVLVSWVQQASFDPPMVSVCLKAGRPAVDFVNGSKRFLINVLGENPSAHFRHFGKGFGPDEDAFAGLGTEPTDFGPLLPDCVAHLGCKLVDHVKAGDHILCLGEIEAAGGDADEKPYVHTRRSGLSY
jgi:flavin reductase (DIM6/NTAB) family NADH-FMN oxidoreductase RutF